MDSVIYFLVLTVVFFFVFVIDFLFKISWTNLFVGFRMLRAYLGMWFIFFTKIHSGVSKQSYILHTKKQKLMIVCMIEYNKFITKIKYSFSYIYFVC